MNDFPTARTIQRRAAAAALALGALLTSPATAQTTYHACYVPSVGALYMIKVTGLPATCLATGHVEIAWADGSVPADGSITTHKLADGAATTPKLGDAAVTVAKLADNAVTSAKILDGAVTSGDILDGTITATDLAAGAITKAKLAPDARVFTVIQTSGNLTALIPTGCSNVGAFSVQVTAPAAGTFVVSARGLYQINHTSGTADLFEVSIGTSSTDCAFG